MSVRVVHDASRPDFPSKFCEEDVSRTDFRLACRNFRPGLRVGAVWMEESDAVLVVSVRQRISLGSAGMARLCLSAQRIRTMALAVTGAIGRCGALGLGEGLTTS